MCDGCHRKNVTTVTAVINGRFGQYCGICLQTNLRGHNARSAQYARDRDRDAHEADMIQPWDANGNPNPEFIRMYPDEAALNFTKEEIEKFN